MPAASVLVGCNTSGCSDNHSALPLLGFYRSTTHASLTLDSLAIGGVGAPGDSLLVHPGENVTQLYLPFRQDASVTSFYIRYAYASQGLDRPELNDTVTFHYSASPYFASEECGAMYQYRVHRVDYTRHLIDSVAVTDSMVTNIERERFQIYIRVAETPEEGEEQ